jgi:hypothetical protein
MSVLSEQQKFLKTVFCFVVEKMVKKVVEARSEFIKT